MKTKILIYSLLLIEVLLLLTRSCKKDDERNVETILFNPHLTYGTITDIDGNVYKTITIGTQTWMAENLKVTKYRNGDTIPNLKVDSDWSNTTKGACCDFNNSPGNSKTYGKLYNWFALNDSRNLAPSGWHVPSEADWAVLMEYLGGKEIAAIKLAETGKTHWEYQNLVTTNESGFTGLPGSNRNDSGFFSIAAYFGEWWISTEAPANQAWFSGIYPGYQEVLYTSNPKGCGKSIRCLRD